MSVKKVSEIFLILYLTICCVGSSQVAEQNQ